MATPPGNPVPIVWLASYPKAGNTWMRLLLMYLLRPDAADWTPDQPLSRTVINPLHRSHVEELCLLDASMLTPTESDLLRPRLYEVAARSTLQADAGQHFFKVHDAYRYNSAGIPVLGDSPGQKAVYLVRDPRDVAISLAVFTNQTTAAAVDAMNRQDHFLAAASCRFNAQVSQHLLDWSGHARSWLDQERIPVLLVRYEDLRAAPATWLQQVADFVGLRASRAQIEHAVRMTRFERLQQAEARHGFGEHLGSASSRFFRRAEPGEWRQMLEPQLVLALEAAHWRMMQRLGYALSDAATQMTRTMNLVEGAANDQRHLHR